MISPDRCRRRSSLRIAIHTQHFAGVGHHVRATRIARAFREVPGSGHEVLVFDGGRSFAGPGRDPPDDGGRVQLPPVVWGANGLDTCDGLSLTEVLAARRHRLVEGLQRLRPDVFLVDSFPFSRWALREEILAGIRQARASNDSVRVVCSLRDVPRTSGPAPETGPGNASPQTWPVRPGDDGLDEVPGLLATHFDALLVHGDPRVTRLEEQFPWVRELGIPIRYTGYVPPASAPGPPVPVPGPAGPLVVVSVGGGVNGLRLIELATAAWGALKGEPRWAAGRMVVFGGALMTDCDLTAAAAACRRHGARFEPFSHDFPAWLRAADLSISRAGYNTLVDLLAARVRAIVLPATDVSDQALRARRMAQLGIVMTAEESALDARRFAGMIGAALARTPPAHDVALDGAERTVGLLTEMVAARPVCAVTG